MVLLQNFVYANLPISRRIKLVVDIPDLGVDYLDLGDWLAIDYLDLGD